MGDVLKKIASYCKRRWSTSTSCTASANERNDLTYAPLQTLPSTTTSDSVVPTNLPVRIECSAIKQPIDGQDCCWPLVAVQNRHKGCGGILFADSATRPKAVCYVGSTGLQFGRCNREGTAEYYDDEAAIAVCIAAVTEAMSSRTRWRRLPFWYLERSLISPLRDQLKAQEVCVHLFESPNPMGMFILRPDVKLGARPVLPQGCLLRRLNNDDAAQVNEESSPGPNQMESSGIGCWGVEVSGLLKGWAVRGADGAIGMLHVSTEWRQRKIATAIVYHISEELQSAGLPCFVYVRDDNVPSRKTFFRIGYERVVDVKFCTVSR